MTEEFGKGWRIKAKKRVLRTHRSWSGEEALKWLRQE